MAKKVLIIGAGLTGLSAGIYLQKQGIQTEIFEISGQAGGMCTAWERKGYRFDGCIHWMVGTKPGTPFNDLYREVNALEEDTVIYNTESLKTEINGITYEIPLTLEKFKAFLLDISPEDSMSIEALCKDINTMMTTTMPAGAPSGISDMLHFLIHCRGFLKLANKSVGIAVKDIAEGYKSSLLKEIIYRLMSPNYSMMALLMMLGTRMGGNAGYPLGGAYEVVARMEKLYKSLGGTLHFRSKVDKIVVQDGRATALESGGTTHKADAIVAACDLYSVLKHMLDGKYPHKQLEALFESAELFEPLSVVSFGLNRRFNLPSSLDLICPEGIRIDADNTSHYLNLRSFEFDPSSAPEGCSSVMVLLNCPLEYWQELRNSNPEGYRIRKQELSEEVLNILDKRIPGFRAAVEVVDVATPATYIRYANLYKGSWEGFAPTPASLKARISKKVKGVDGLFLAGQWTTVGGGLYTAVSSGKDIAAAVGKSL